MATKQMLSNWVAAFDFDHTLIDANSDVEVTRLFPNSKVPEEIRHLYRQDGWTAYMGQIFQHLHQLGVSPEQMLSCVSSIPFTSGMTQLLLDLWKSGARVMIVSDSNSKFISSCLESNGLSDCVDKIFTNPAKFDASGKLEIEMYHLQDWCKLSTKNLCKGSILDSYLKEVGIEGVRVAYVGDGRNDLCPALRLSSTDIVFPRVGYSLADLVNGADLKAKVHPWSDGHEIWEVLCKEMQ